MIRLLLIILATFSCSLFCFSQKNPLPVITWRAVLHREDGNDIAFNFEQQQKNNKTILIIKNAGERLKVDSVTFIKDSVFIKMPVFESAFSASTKNGSWNGIWARGTSATTQIMTFTATPGSTRFPLTNGPAAYNISGRWAVNFASDSTKNATSIAEFSHSGNKVTGTFITPTGDYRFLEGIVTGKQLKMSGFDGAHAVLFTGDITANNTIENGKFFSGAKSTDSWTAVKNQQATVKVDESAMYLKPGEEKLDFKFKDINGTEVSINDERFKNKVVVVQLMGSWCPNCMDETQFLSDYYNKNKQRGVEMVALAYEYSTDFNRSQQSLRKFQQRFNVQYPVLITGVTVSDTLRTEKTLPQVTRIKVFPSSIILDKAGKVRKLDTGFFGPGTGAHYEAYKKEFYETINKLLAE